MTPTRWTSLFATAATLALTATLAPAQTTTPTEKKPAPKSITPAPAQPARPTSTTPAPASKPQTTTPATPSSKTPANPTLSDDELRAQWEKANQPGPMHKKLEPLVGTFTAHAKFFRPGSTEPEESTGTSVQKWVLGGRFLQQDFSGSMMGKPFTGVGFFGYDNAAQRYTSSWVSSMTTSIQIQSGVVDSTNKVFTMVSTYKDANTGEEHDNRSLMTIIDNNTNTYQTFEHGPDGKEYKVLEITYTRTK